jgi:hypothetical protein
MNTIVGRDVSHLVVALDAIEYNKLIEQMGVDYCEPLFEFELNHIALDFLHSLFETDQFKINDKLRVVKNKVNVINKPSFNKCSNIDVDWKDVYKEYRIIRNVRTPEGMVIVEPIVCNKTCKLYLGYAIGEDFTKESIYDSFEVYCAVELEKITSGKYQVTNTCESQIGQVDFILKHTNFGIMI